MRQIWKHRYQIMEKLGSGGTGQVYRVWDLLLEKEWAMKELEGDCDQELKALKQLSHHRFPRVVDAFKEAGKNFLVMDYVPGPTLEEILKKGPMEEKQLIVIGKQIIQALRYLHESSPVLLYLDLKPSNIILDEDGQVKLVDFGSVMVKGKSASVSGTLGFASPEQIQVRNKGKSLNEQSDIFSLGMVLFAIATGNTRRLPVVEEGRHHGIFVSRYNPLISPMLEKIIETCTRGVPEKRYLSVRDIYGKLELLEKRLEKQKRIFPRRSRFLFKRDWQQEKSFLCTQARAAIYISGRNVCGLLAGLALTMVLSILVGVFSGSRSLAREKEGEYSSEISGEENLSVILRDRAGRKVLVREGKAYRTQENLFFEIPWEGLEEDSCKITILCQEEGGKTRYFHLQCEKN